MWHVARRPKWIAALVLALAVAAVFAGLGQWQLERSLDGAQEDTRQTETVVALTSLERPQSIITTEASGRMVSVECVVVPSDDIWVTDRPMAQGRGDWLIRHCVTAEGFSLALAAGWLESGLSKPVKVVATGSPTVVGRYVPTESPQTSDFAAGERSAVSVAELINLWENPGPVYGGYLVLDPAPEGLLTISTEPPVQQGSLNWLNVFYAAEWALFALFALYLWYRLVRDEWEREREGEVADVKL